MPLAQGGDQDLVGVGAGQVVDVWRDLLGSPPRGASSDFFASGGDSLLAFRFVSALRERHGIALDLKGFMEDSRFGSLVERCAPHG
ncbi:phosphopantetheine-binding protein [Nocardiopsis exhalans]|uniref:Phosphopantetheine-binding protein n=1 Tax=Nocardiopsis exhalans TaxID=163604 RepID=A0ABY5D962_9ACTN|nr:phosphopantetheine-binding protein [Nocardiopsis exhalans]USY20882.1 phosphopantetheine-binding protein [Nocardiopsis exhalans]